MVTVHLPNVLGKLAGGHRRVTAQGATVGAVIDDLTRRYPALGPRLRDGAGRPYEFVVIYRNDEDIRLTGGFDGPV
jgi:molybdopterin converting factor small subunit